jgi:ABC-2 type transport system ATP-binding protein
VEVVIQTEALTKYYGAHRGIIDVDLAVNQGEAFGFLGPNGAGKTTTIRLLLDHIRPTSGRATVFGIETTADPIAIHRRVGYLPGEFSLYDGLTGAQTIDYFANLHGGVDAAYQRALIERLGLDPSRRYREYSRGNKQKVALVVALQHKPDLLILDEPTAGLDPLVQQDFFHLLHEATSEGRSVFLSSHIISEVERVCDRVAIIREGRLVEVDAVSALRRMAVHHVELRFATAGPVAEIERLEGVKVERMLDEGQMLVLQVAGPIGPVVEAAARHQLVDLVSREPNLEDVFLAHYGRGNTDMARVDNG